MLGARRIRTEPPHKDSAMNKKIQDDKFESDLSERGTNYRPGKDPSRDKTESVPPGEHPDPVHPGPDGPGAEGSFGNSI
jgi:hypothetical protein